MFRLVQLLRTSATWRPHAEQIKSWIGTASSDPKSTNLARSYIHNMKVSDYVEEMDDCIELACLMDKVSYPKNNLHTPLLQARMNEYFVNASPEAFENILKICQAYPESFASLCSLYFQDQKSIKYVKEAMEYYDLKEQIRLALIVWTMGIRNKELLSDVKPISFTIANCIAYSLKKESSDVFAFIHSLALGGAPLHDDTARELLTQILKKTERFSLDELLKISVALDHSVIDSPEWMVALQVAFAKKYHKGKIAEAILFLQFLARNSQVGPRKEIVAIFDRQIDELQGQLLIDFSKTLSMYKLSDHSVDLFTPIEEKLVTKLDALIKNDAASLDDKVIAYLCLARLQPEATKESFAAFLQDTNIKLISRDYLKYLCIIMYLVNMYSADTVSFIATKGIDLGQEGCIYYLLASLETGALVVRVADIKTAYGKGMRQGMTYRSGRAATANSPTLDSESTIVLISVLLRLHSAGKLEDGYHLALSLFENSTLSSHMKLRLLSSLTDIKVSLEFRKRAVATVINEVQILTVLDMDSIINTLRDTNFRDAMAIERVVSKFKKSSPSLKETLRVVAVAHVCGFHRLLQRSNIIVLGDHTHELDDLSHKETLILLKTCSAAQRSELASREGLWKKLEATHLPSTDTADLILMLIVLSADVKSGVKVDILKEISGRAPLSEDCIDVSADEIVSAAEVVSKISPQNMGMFFRCCGKPLILQGDERHVMRIFCCLAPLDECPSIVFRVVGRVLGRVVHKLSPDNAIQWLSFYTRHNVRDDSVGKLLFRRVNSPSIALSQEAERNLVVAAKFFGQQYTPRKRTRRMNKTSHRDLFGPL